MMLLSWGEVFWVHAVGLGDGLGRREVRGCVSELKAGRVWRAA